jgi:hypothetical protein
MPTPHSRRYNQAINIRRFKPRDIIRAGPGRLLNHVQQVRLPHAELACSPADDDGVLFLCHICISPLLLLSFSLCE